MSSRFAMQIDGIIQLSGMQLRGQLMQEKSPFGFWFSTFCSNKQVMQLSGMRLSGLYCIA